jgi:hypothetical protein
MSTTAKCYDDYKLAWMAGGQLHSTMHPTLAEARAAERTVPQPRMIMKLAAQGGNSQYAWELMPGPWADAVRHWEWITLGVVVLVAVLLMSRK